MAKIANPKKKLVSISFDTDLIDEMDKLAEKLGISRSAMVNLTMRAAILGETKNMGALLVQGIAKAKADMADESNEAVAVAG